MITAYGLGQLTKTVKSATDNLNKHYHREAVEVIRIFS